jgi:hypothetical protein
MTMLNSRSSADESALTNTAIGNAIKQGLAYVNYYVVLFGPESDGIWKAADKFYRGARSYWQEDLATFFLSRETLQSTLMNTNAALPTRECFATELTRNSVQSSSLGNKLEEAKRLERSGRGASALDAICNEIDDRFLAGDFESCDAFLRTLNAKQLSPLLIVGILSVTLAASKKLKNRRRFYDAAYEQLPSKGKDPAELIGGLSGRSNDVKDSSLRTKSV